MKKTILSLLALFTPKPIAILLSAEFEYASGNLLLLNLKRISVALVQSLTSTAKFKFTIPEGIPLTAHKCLPLSPVPNILLTR